MTLRQDLIDLLLGHPDGLLVEQMATAIGCDVTAVNNMVRRVYGCYIASWTKTTRAPRAVWAIVTVPTNAPRESCDWKNPEFRSNYMREYRASRPTPVKKPKIVQPVQPTVIKTTWRPIA